MSNKNYHGDEIDAFETSGVSPGPNQVLLRKAERDQNRHSSSGGGARVHQDVDAVYGNKQFISLSALQRRTGLGRTLLQTALDYDKLEGYYVESPETGRTVRILISRSAFATWLERSS